MGTSVVSKWNCNDITSDTSTKRIKANLEEIEQTAADLKETGGRANLLLANDVLQIIESLNEQFDKYFGND